MERHGADTAGLWRVIVALAVVVAALIVVDPFSVVPPPAERVGNEIPVVAYFPQDAEPARPQADAPANDEVLGVQRASASAASAERTDSLDQGSD